VHLHAERQTPFAGHPTIGTAFALAHAGVIKAGTVRTVFGLGAGPTPIDLDWNGSSLRFAWMTQLNPTFGKTVTDTAALASALGLEPAALAGQRAPAQEVNCGSNFFVVPVATRKAVDAAAIDRAKVDAVFAAAGIQRRGIYIFRRRGQIRGQVGGQIRGQIWSPTVGCQAVGIGRSAGHRVGCGPAGCFIAKLSGFVPAARVNAIVFSKACWFGDRAASTSMTMTGGTTSRGSKLADRCGGRRRNGYSSRR
jgi:hypothetical protein